MAFYSIKLKNSLKKPTIFGNSFIFWIAFEFSLEFSLLFEMKNLKKNLHLFVKHPVTIIIMFAALVFWVGLTDWHRWWFSPDPGKKLVQEQFDESLRGFELTQGNIFARLTCKMASWACHHWTTVDGNKYLFYLGLMVIIKKLTSYRRPLFFICTRKNQVLFNKGIWFFLVHKYENKGLKIGNKIFITTCFDKF